MKIINYVKKPEGLVILGGREICNQPPTTAIDRYNSFFDSVPLHGGQEWRTLDPFEIADIFRQAAKEGIEHHQHKREQAIAEHRKKSGLVRWWRTGVQNWKAPEVPTVKELTEEIIARCMRLADWMEMQQHRPFYTGSDMSDFILKPRRVADLLRWE